MASQANEKRTIFVTGGTGIQGIEVVRTLIAADKDGNPSPWKVKVLTRDPSSDRAKGLAALGVELIEGNFFDFNVICEAMKGCYGAWINTDSFSMGEMAETYAGSRMFECAKHAGVRHFVWSSLDDVLTKGGFDPQYRAEHYTAKAAVTNWMKSQPSNPNDANGMLWTSLATGPYMEALIENFGPLKKRQDGTYVFASPIENGHVPFCAVKDIAFWSRYIFENPATTSGQDIEMCSELVSWPHLVETFSRVTGQKAEFVRVTMDQYFSVVSNGDAPLATDIKGGTTLEENFRKFWALFRDDILTRDMDAIRAIHPGTTTLEQFLRESKWDGSRDIVLKTSEDRKDYMFLVDQKLIEGL